METEASLGDQMIMGRFYAGVELLGRAGAKEVHVDYLKLDNAHCPAEVLWVGQAGWGDQIVLSAHFSYPAQAIEDLCTQVLDGGLCLNCERTTVMWIEAPGLCTQSLIAGDIGNPETYCYKRGCE